MIGTIFNAAAIVIGGIAGLTMKQPLSGSTQAAFKIFLGACVTFFGLRLTWLSISEGSAGQAFKQLLVVVLAMILGKLCGRLLRLQKLSNRLGQFAKTRMEHAQTSPTKRPSDGFNACTVLFCAAPLGIVGATTDGLSAYSTPLIAKAVMDALAAVAFVPLFGWGVMLSAIPVLAFQGSITLIAREIARTIDPQLVLSINATAGLLIFTVALVIFQLKRIDLADYLPSLVFAPVITWLLR